MKILHVLPGIEIESGGVAVAASGMAEAVAERGHIVSIACLNRGGTLLQPQHVKVHGFAPDRNSSLAASAKLRGYLRDHVVEFDVVHIHGLWQRPGHYAAAAANRERIPYVVTPHGMLDANSLAMGRRWAKSVAWFLWDSAIVKRAAAIHCLNNAEMRCSPALASTKNTVIGNGIFLAILGNLPTRGLWRQQMKSYIGDASRPVALFLSRIHPKKGLERLLPHWRALLNRHPNLLLVIAGTGESPHVEAIHQAVKEYGLESAVFFAGQISGTTKWQALVDADIFILPSHQEGFSMAITEAMAAGLPVVITRECNFDEVEQNHTGVIIEHGDMAAFVQAAAMLLGDQKNRASIGQNGQALVREKFTWEAAAEQLEKLYRTVCSRGGDKSVNLNADAKF